MSLSQHMILFQSVALTFVVTIACPARASFLEVDSTFPLIFEGARLGVQPAAQPFSVSIFDVDDVIVLHLGDYGPADANQTRSLTKATTIPGEWDAALDAWRRGGRSWYWMGLESAKVQNGSNLHVATIRDSFALFNLQRIDVKPLSSRVWHDNGNTYHRTEMSISFVWLIPEPASVVLLLMAGSAAVFNRRR